MSEKKGIKETTELVALVSVGILLARKTTEDGKFGLMDVWAVFQQRKVLMDGLEGIAEVPAELLDLDVMESESIAAQVAKILVECGLSHRVGDVTKELIGAATDVVRRIVGAINLPVSAVPAE